MKEYRSSKPKPTKRHLGMTPDIFYLSLGLDSSGDDGIRFDIDFSNHEKSNENFERYHDKFNDEFSVKRSKSDPPSDKTNVIILP